MMHRERLAVLMGVVSFAAGCGGGTDVPAIAILTTELAQGRLGAAYDEKIEAIGGTPPLAFALAEGSLPSGLELKAATGQITGVAGTPGKASFTVFVTDAEKARASAALSIYVVPDPLEIVTTVLPSGKEGSPYDHVLTARGGVGPLVWSVSGGALPAGVAIEPAGLLRGTPSDSGGFDFKVRVTDAESAVREQMLHLTLVSLNPMIVTSTVEKGRTGQPYSATLVAEGGEPPYTWQLAGGRLPAGVNLASDGSLAGVPTEAGEFIAMVLVADSAQRRDTADITLRVIAPLAIGTAQLAQAIRDRPYDFTLQATGGEPPYTWSIGSGVLPSGITFDASGRLTGMSSAVGDYPLTLRVRDTEGFQRSALFELKVSDRFTFDVQPALSFPPVCTATAVSYQHVDIVVPDSMQISDLNVSVDITYPGDPARLRVVLLAPDGSQSPLCGNGANVPGGLECDARALALAYDDDGAAANRPERPLSVFDGLNPQGTWRLYVAVIEPTCNRIGTINSVSLSIRDERAPDDYVVVRGFGTNNLVITPFVRVIGGGLDEHDLFLTATAYDVGPNGFPEGGKGDDRPRAAPLVWSWQGAPVPGTTLTPDGHVLAGSPTGQASITASGGGFVVTLPLRVVPPDWNPAARVY